MRADFPAGHLRRRRINPVHPQPLVGRPDPVNDRPRDVLHLLRPRACSNHRNLLAGVGESGRCVKCGYDLRGDMEQGCPECGWNRDP